MALTYVGCYVNQDNDFVALRVKDPEAGITVNMWNVAFQDGFGKNAELALELAANITPTLAPCSGFHNINVGDNDLRAALVRIGVSPRDPVWPT